jgi:hypothetical protein
VNSYRGLDRSKPVLERRDRQTGSGARGHFLESSAGCFDSNCSLLRCAAKAGNTTDFSGTRLEPLTGDGMFRHFRLIFRGPLIANVNMAAERDNRLIEPSLADPVAFGRPYIANPESRRTLRNRCATRESIRVASTTSRCQNLCLCQSTSVTSASIHEHPLTETHMAKTSPQQNKALVLEAFDTLFNKRDYAAAGRFWSDRYIQHSAHIAPGRDGLFNLSGRCPARCVTRIS